MTRYRFRRETGHSSGFRVWKPSQLVHLFVPPVPPNILPTPGPHIMMLFFFPFLGEGFKSCMDTPNSLLVKVQEETMNPVKNEQNQNESRRKEKGNVALLWCLLVRYYNLQISQLGPQIVFRPHPPHHHHCQNRHRTRLSGSKYTFSWGKGYAESTNKAKT